MDTTYELKGIESRKEFLGLWESATHAEVKLGLLHALTSKNYPILDSHQSLVEMKRDPDTRGWKASFFLGVAVEAFRGDDQAYADYDAGRRSTVGSQPHKLLWSTALFSAMRESFSSSGIGNYEANTDHETLLGILRFLANRKVYYWGHWREPYVRATGMFLEEYYRWWGKQSAKPPLSDEWYDAVIIYGQTELLEKFADQDKRVVDRATFLLRQSADSSRRQRRDRSDYSLSRFAGIERSWKPQMERRWAEILVIQMARCGMLDLLVKL